MVDKRQLKKHEKIRIHTFLSFSQQNELLIRQEKTYAHEDRSHNDF
jgi:hypothetical protein